MDYSKIRKSIVTGVLSATTVTSLLFNLTISSASGGRYDVSFSGNGRLVTDFSTGEDVANDVAIQPDGNLVVIGKSILGTSKIAIARYLPGGTLDTSFSGDGKVTTDTIDNGQSANTVAIQADGKIVVAGESNNISGATNFMIARYLSNGTLDNSFDGDGVIYTAGGLGTSSSATDVALQGDGKIVIVRNSNFSGIATCLVARYNSNGSIDTTFNTTGQATPCSGQGASVQALAIQSDGKILVGGSMAPSSTADFAIARYNSNGTLDTTFSGDGLVSTDFSGGSDVIASMRIQADGKIVAAGNASSDFALARYNADGSLDASFDGDGKVTTNLNSSGSDSASEIAIQANGKIVGAGVNGNNDFVIVRYNMNGSLDPAFGTNGILYSDISSSSEDASNAIVIQNDQKIVVAGTAKSTTGGATKNFAVARYLPAEAPFDFEGDGKTDVGIFRPAAGQWWINRSSTGATFTASFGASPDKIVPADFTGDGKTDVAFWRPAAGQWFVLRSDDFSFYAFPFGAIGDVPVPADYDGDGKADAAVFRESSLTWYISKSSGGTDIVGFGAAGDKPVNADYDGDAKSDIAIFRPNGANGAEWWIRRSSNASVFALQFGSSTDKAVPGDFTGDGKADVAFWRPSTGAWNVLRSEDFSYYAFPFGANGDVASPGDYDGDGKIDAAVFRPSNSNWFVNRSGGGTLIQQFGVAGDVPLPSAFVR